MNKFRMFVKVGGNSSEEKAPLEALPLLDMAEFTWNSFSCVWDFATFLTHMYSLIYKEGWGHT